MQQLMQKGPMEHPAQQQLLHKAAVVESLTILVLLRPLLLLLLLLSANLLQDCQDCLTESLMEVPPLLPPLIARLLPGCLRECC